MSLNFTFKDISHYDEQTKIYLKSTVLLIAVTIFFINLTQSLGLFLVQSDIHIYNLSIIQFYSQFNEFLMIMMFIAANIVVASQNHAIILHRRKDIAVMQSLGTYPRQLYSFYITELLVLVVIAFFLGAILGFGAFVLAFIILEGFITILSLEPRYLFYRVLFLLLIGITYVYNGWEIRSIGRKTYAQTKSGSIDANVKAHFNPKIENWLATFSMSLKIGIQNLIRKGSQFRQLIAVLSISAGIILTGFIGMLVLQTTSQNEVSQTQGNDIYAIGPTPVLNDVVQGYEKFNNISVSDLQPAEFYNPSYNLTSNQTSLQTLLANYGNIQTSYRAFLVTTMITESGHVQNYTSDGDINGLIAVTSPTRTRVVPIQAVDFNDTLQNPNMMTMYSIYTEGARMGDTLAVELFNNAFEQSFSFSIDTINVTFNYNIVSGVIDPFNNGNCIYINYNSIASQPEFGNFTNLIFINYAPILASGHYQEFLVAIQDYIHSLGPLFSGVDLEPVFQQNANSIYSMSDTTIIINCIIALVMVVAIYEFEKGRIEDDEKDLFIMKSIGTSSKFIQQTMFFLNRGLSLSWEHQLD